MPRGLVPRFAAVLPQRVENNNTVPAEILLPIIAIVCIIVVLLWYILYRQYRRDEAAAPAPASDSASIELHKQTGGKGAEPTAKVIDPNTRTGE